MEPDRPHNALSGGSRVARRFLWHFLPEASIVRKFSFQRFSASTFLSDGARAAVRYGALVAVVESGGGAFRSALLGTISELHLEDDEIAELVAAADPRSAGRR